MENIVKIAKCSNELFQYSREPVIVNPVLFNELDTYFTQLLNANNNAMIYEMTYNTKGDRRPDQYTGKITTVHKSTITLKIVEGHRLLTIDRYWNVYNYPYERYFIYNGAWYYHQPAKTNEWQRNIPELYIQITGEPKKLIKDIDDSITLGTSVKASKETLQAIGMFLGVDNHFVITAKRK